MANERAAACGFALGVNRLDWEMVIQGDCSGCTWTYCAYVVLKIAQICWCKSSDDRKIKWRCKMLLLFLASCWFTDYIYLLPSCKTVYSSWPLLSMYIYIEHNHKLVLVCSNPCALNISIFVVSGIGNLWIHDSAFCIRSVCIKAWDNEQKLIKTLHTVVEMKATV